MVGRKALDRKIWGIAWPAMLSNISIPVLGLVDAAILGHLDSSHYLGAVAIGSAVLSFLFWGFSFFRMGTTGLVARAAGAGDEQAASLILIRSVLLALAIAALLLLAGGPLSALGVGIMQPEGAIVAPAESYIHIRLMSAPAVLVTYTVMGWFIGHQDTRWPLVILLITNAVNIVLDWLLVLQLGLNSDGAALATVMAEYLGLLLALYAVLASGRLRWPDGLRRHLADLAAFRRLLMTNRHLMVRTWCLLACFAFFAAMGDNLGPTVLAANSIMIQLLMLSAFALDGIAYAAEGLAGQKLGAGDLPGFRTVNRRCGYWTAITASVIAVALLVGTTPLVLLLTDLPAVRAVMREHFIWVVLMPLLAGPSYLLDGIFIGSTETRPMMQSMLVSACLVYLPLWYLAQPLGNHGLWLAFAAFNAARGMTLGAWYLALNRRGAWLGVHG